MKTSRRRDHALVINLWHLKATNGMFYYACDYVRAIRAPAVVLLNRKFRQVEPSTLGDLPQRRVGLLGYLGFWVELLWSRSPVFTPTPHPLPFIRRQLIVVHDSYPFRRTGGLICLVKKALLRISLATSRCKVAYINNTDSRRFVEKLVKAEERRIFLPNHFPSPGVLPRRRHRSDRVFVGLIGTDSSKKNYAKLFSVVSKRQLSERFEFLVLGHDTEYFRQTCGMFPQLRIRLVPSDSSSLDAFLGDVDCVVSVATNEGFGRPIAHALSRGVPCFLIEDEVFREFYDGWAVFSADIDALVSRLLDPDSYPQNTRPLLIPSAVHAAIDNGLRILNAL